MRSRPGFLGLVVVLLTSLVGSVAYAGPVSTFDVLDSGADNSVSVVQVDGSPDCFIGLGNCLADGPLLIDSASITLDLGTGEILDLNIFAAGPGTIQLNGYNGYEKIVLTDAAFQSSGPATLGPGGSFNIAGAVTAAQLDLFLAGNDGAIADITVLNYTTAPNLNLASGTVGISGDQVAVSVQGLDFGFFPDPVTGENPVAVKADFGFVAVVPEPSAALLYGIGLLIAGPAMRRRAAAPVAR